MSRSTVMRMRSPLTIASRTFSTQSFNGLVDWMGTNGGAAGFVNPSIGTVTYPFTATSLSAIDGTRTADKAFDHNLNTEGNEFHSALGAGQWLMMDFGSRRIEVNHYCIFGRTNSLHAPRNWELQGSNNGTSWTVLDTQSTNASVGNGTNFSGPVSNTNKWRYVRILQTGLNSSDSTYLTVGDLELWGTLTPLAGPSEFPWTETWTGIDGAEWDSSKWDATRIKAGSTGSSTIQSNKGQMVATPGSFAWTSRKSKMPAVADLDVAGTLTFTSGGEQYAGVTVRGTGTLTGDSGATFSDGYNFLFFITANGVIRARIDRWIDAGRTEFGVTNVGLDSDVTPTIAFRVQAFGTSLKMRAWDPGGVEPSAWNVSITDPSHTTGEMLLNLYGGSGLGSTVQWDDLTIHVPSTFPMTLPFTLA